MWKYIVKRLLMMIPIVFAISFVVFCVVSISPVSPARTILGIDATEENVAKLEEQLGLDKSLPERYVNYMASLFQGDMGTSYATGDSVISMIGGRFPITLKISAFSVVVSILVGVPVGILSATKQYSIFDTCTTIGALITYSLPSFLFGLFLLYIFSYVLGLVPSFGVDSWQGYILPSMTLGIGTASSIMRTTRSTLLEVIRSDYVRTARGKGVPERIVIYKHALKNAIIPVITVAGTSFGGLLGGAVVVESVFAIPGMGTLLTTGITQNDMPVVMGGVLFLAVAFSLVNLLVDVIYAFVDPRIKAEYKRK